MIQLDIGPSLQNIQQRNKLSPIADFIQGREAGMKAAIGRNQLATIDRENQARPLAGAALNGDVNALKQLNVLDPGQGQQVAAATGQDYKSKLDRTGAWLVAAKDQGPQAWADAVSRSAAELGGSADPHELDIKNADAVIAQHMGLSKFLDQRNSDRNFNLQEKQFGANQSNAAFDRNYKMEDLALRRESASPQTEITDIGGRRVLIDKRTGATVNDMGESPSKQQNAPTGYKMNDDGTVSRLPGYKDVNLEQDMRKEFDGQTKDFRAVRDSYNRIQASAEKPTPAGDLSMIFNYMKMLDPGSVVRESEFATAANAAPLLTRIGLDPAKYAAVWNGEKLTPEQRADFLNRANQLYGEQETTFKSLADQYTDTAKRNGLDPSNIILTPLSNPRKGTKGTFTWTPDGGLQ